MIMIMIVVVIVRVVMRVVVRLGDARLHPRDGRGERESDQERRRQREPVVAMELQLGQQVAGRDAHEGSRAEGECVREHGVAVSLRHAEPQAWYDAWCKMLAAGTMPTLDPDPCHCGEGDHGPINYHLSVYDGRHS